MPLVLTGTNALLPYIDHANYVRVILLSYAELQKKPVEGFSAGLIDDDDIYQWEVLVMGPPDTF